MGRCGGPLTPLLPLLLLCLPLLWGAGSFAGVAAARLPLGRLAPGPSVEEDNPLPSKLANPQHRRCAALPARVLRQVLGPAYNPAYMAFSLDEPGPDSHRGGGGGGGGGSSYGFSMFQMDAMHAGEADDNGGSQSLSRVLKESPWSPASLAGPAGSRHEAASPFSVDEHYREVLSDEPAWSVRYDMPTVMLSGDADQGGRGPRQVDVEPERAAGDQDGDAGRAERAEHAQRVERAALPYGDDMQWHCESPLRWLDLGPNYFPRYLRSADCSHHTCAGNRFVCSPRSFTVKVLRRREGMCAPASGLQGLQGLPPEESNLPRELRDLWIWELRAVNFCCVCRMRM